MNVQSKLVNIRNTFHLTENEWSVSQSHSLKLRRNQYLLSDHSRWKQDPRVFCLLPPPPSRAGGRPPKRLHGHNFLHKQPHPATATSLLFQFKSNSHISQSICERVHRLLHLSLTQGLASQRSISTTVDGT